MGDMRDTAEIFFHACQRSETMVLANAATWTNSKARDAKYFAEHLRRASLVQQRLLAWKLALGGARDAKPVDLEPMDIGCAECGALPSERCRVPEQPTKDTADHAIRVSEAQAVTARLRGELAAVRRV